MKILVTGARGFVGKNLVAHLNNIKDGKEKTSPLGDTPDLEVYQYHRETTDEELEGYCKDADFVVHLAGINRPLNPEEFQTGNVDLTKRIVDLLAKNQNKATILLSSSIQAELDNPYGKSKLDGEEVVKEHARINGSKAIIYRFTNLFGKWCKPNYNSVVATWCNNIATGQEITINDRDIQLKLTYIDDVLEEITRAIAGMETRIDEFYAEVPLVHHVTLGRIADLLFQFKNSRNTLEVPKLDDSFVKALYSTYLSYLPAEEFKYSLKMNVDPRGSFTEIIRTPDRGQFSVNISKPGITKGQHWHHTKNEKFVVVKGHGLIQLRKEGIDDDGNPYPIVEFEVSGDNIDVVEMIPGYTHNIINLSETEDLVTFMWANEAFNPNRPDTYFDPV